MNRRRRASLRARCRDLLEQLDIRSPEQGGLSVADLRRRVEHFRGRRLHLLGVIAGPGWPSGWWFEGPHSDFVVYDVQTSALHQIHIIAHEFGHILFGHVGAADEAMAPMFRRLRTDPATPVMHRNGHGPNGYGVVEEREAEVFATMICQLVGHQLVPRDTNLHADDKALIDRLLQALADHRGSV